MVQIIQVTPEELVEMISNSVKMHFETFCQSSITIPCSEEKEFITRKELKEILSVSYVTIHNHVKRGILTKKYIGNKPYFKMSEVKKLLE
jgi:hypothetical protein